MWMTTFGPIYGMNACWCGFLHVAGGFSRPPCSIALPPLRGNLHRTCSRANPWPAARRRAPPSAPGGRQPPRRRSPRQRLAGSTPVATAINRRLQLMGAAPGSRLGRARSGCRASVSVTRKSGFNPRTATTSRERAPGFHGPHAPAQGAASPPSRRGSAAVTRSRAKSTAV